LRLQRSAFSAKLKWECILPEDVLNKVISFLAGDSGPVSDEQLLLRQIFKELPQNKYAKFYKPRTEDVDPALAQWFYAMYKTVYPARTFTLDTAQLPRIKQTVVESFLDRGTLDTARRLSPGQIEARAKTASPTDLARELKNELGILSEAFEQSWTASADKCYNAILAFVQFCNFNFLGLLQKFDPKFTEGNFNYQPKFEPIKADFIAKNLNEFLIASEAIDPDQDWKSILGTLKACRGGVDVVSPVLWSGLTMDLQDVKRSNILTIIVQLTLKNPIWQWKSKRVEEQLTETWISSKRDDVQGVIDRILNARQSAQIETLVRAVFSSADVIRLNHYTPKESVPFTKRELTDYAYAGGANYLQAFLEDYFDREIRDLCDILLVRGQWTSSQLSREMSEAFHELTEIPGQLLAVDESLSDEGKNGPRLKAALGRVDRDRTQARYIENILEDLNDEVLEIINTAAQALIVIGKHLKVMVEDIQKNPHDLIINWKELASVSRDPIGQRISDAYKRINYFIQLLRLCTRPPEI
jgi:hypothetical protein